MNNQNCLSRGRISSVILIILIAAVAIPGFYPNRVNATQTAHSAISISGDAGFTAANGVTGGTGTASDPYVISGWSIEYLFVPAQISVSNTRAYFVIRNVTAYGAGDGIIVSNVTNGRLENLESGGGGVPGSSGVGILVSGSNMVTITGVTVSSGGTPHEGGGGPGIIIQSSSNVLVANNNIPGNYGTDLTVDSSSTNVTITGNSIGGSQTGNGMNLSGVNVTVSQNAFHNSGLVFSDSVKVASDNTVNGKPLYYYHDCNNLSLNNMPVGLLVIRRCSNVQLSNLSISNTDVGITLSSVHHVLIQNVSSTSNNFDNLQISASSNVTIEHSDFSSLPENYFFGPGALSAVSISGSNNTIIDGSVFVASQLALSLSSDVNATVSGNTFAHGNGMLCLYSSANIHIYHNNFLIDPDYTWFCESDTQPGHFWDNGFPSGGNYWSSYTGSDPDNDGIGDTPQPIPGGVYQDRYPLMNSYPASIPLTTEFNYAPQYPMTGQTATFKASAVGGVAPYTYTWNFGDGSTGSGRTVTHVYSKAGSSILAVLTVTDSATPQGSRSISHYLIVNSPPPPLTASFSSLCQTVQCSSAPVEYWVSLGATASGGTSPYSFSWSFGDGSTATGASVGHIYCSSGSFNVVLTVKDSGSPQQSVMVQKTFTATSPPSSCVTASLTYSPTSPHVGQNVTFTGTISGGTPPYNSYYVFDDNPAAGPVVGQSATHLYSSPGTFNVEFHVTDSSGGDIIIGQLVTVASPDPTVPVNATITFGGVTLKTTGSLSIGSTTASGTIQIVATNSTTGSVLFSKTYTITSLPITNAQARFLLNVPVSPYPLSANVLIHQIGGVWSATLGVTRQLDLLGHGSVDISDIVTMATSFDSKIGDPGYNPSADFLGRGTIDILDIVTATIYFGATDYS